MYDPSKRAFLRQVFFLGLCSGLSPAWAFSLKDDDLERNLLIDEAVGDYYSFRRQLGNHQKLSSLSPQERERQYNGLLNILKKASDPGFANLSRDEKLATIRDAKPFESSAPVARKEVLKLGPMIYAAGGLALATVLITRGKVLGLAAIMGATLKAPPLLSRAGAVLDAGIMAYSGYQIGKDVLTDSAVASAEAVNAVLNPDRFSLGDFGFEQGIPGMELQVGNYATSLPGSGTGSGAGSGAGSSDAGAMADLMRLLTAGTAGKPGMFSDRQAFEDFLGRYIPMIGSIQEESLRKILEARAKADERRMAEARDSAAFVDSIQQFIGVAVIGKLAAPKEAQILNTLLSTGFELALATVSPIGWVTVGIKLATILSGSNGSDGFNTAVMAALQTIMKQLNIIIEYVEVIQQTQIKILKQLNVILERINDVHELVGSKFTELARQNAMVYSLIEVSAVQRLQSDVAEANRRLGFAVANGDSSEMYEYIQRLTGYALHDLQTITVTKFDSSFHSSADLKAKIVLREKFRYHISLYDSIGLSSSLRNYSSSGHGGMCEGEPIVHPQMFFSVADTVVNWLLVSDLSEKNRRRIAAELLDKAKESNELLRVYSEKQTVERLLDLQYRFGGQIIRRVREDLISYLKGNFPGELVDWKNAVTTRQEDYGYLARSYNVLFNNPDSFFEDSYDSPWITAALQHGAISSLKRVKTVPYKPKSSVREIWHGYMQRPNEVITDFNPGKAAGSKVNKLSFENAVFSFAHGQFFSLEIEYRCELRITKVDLLRGTGVIVNPNNVMAYKQVRDTRALILPEDGWKQKVKDKLKNFSPGILSILPDFDKSSFSFSNFLYHLIEQKQKSDRVKLVERAKELIMRDAESDFDGYGIGSMYLSKLNRSISSGDSSGFLLEYSDMAFIREDFVMMLDELAALDLPVMGDEKRVDFFLEYEAFNDYKDLYEKDEPYEMEWECWDRYLELICAVMNRARVNTYKQTKAGLSAYADGDGEPMLQRAIAKLEGYLKLLD